jgi:hypothetical protein
MCGCVALIRQAARCLPDQVATALAFRYSSGTLRHRVSATDEATLSHLSNNRRARAGGHRDPTTLASAAASSPRLLPLLSVVRCQQMEQRTCLGLPWGKDQDGTRRRAGGYKGTNIGPDGKPPLGRGTAIHVSRDDRQRELLEELRLWQAPYTMGRKLQHHLHNDDWVFSTCCWG